MTHHPPKWLNTEAQQHLYEHIVSHGRFVVHLCGHMHEHAYREFAEGGTGTRRLWQGRSLFGLEYFVKNGKKDCDRSHGYAVGKIELSGNKGKLTFWPRETRLQGYDRVIVPDYSIHLTDDQYIEPREFNLLKLYISPERYQDPQRKLLSTHYKDLRLFRSDHATLRLEKLKTLSYQCLQALSPAKRTLKTYFFAKSLA